MPNRGEAAKPQRQQFQERVQPQGQTAGDEDTIDENDAWGEVMNMKGMDDGSFNKMNTNYYLSNEEEDEIILVDENPFIFFGHSIKCRSSKGKTFYRVEACQKSAGQTCIMCDSQNSAVGKQRKNIAFRIITARGNYDTKSKGFTHDPSPKIFLVPLYLAKMFKTLKDEAGGTITDKVLKLTKNDQYLAQFSLLKNGKTMTYKDAPDFEGELPEVMEVYAPMDDKELTDFIQRFADGGIAATTAQPGGFAAKGTVAKPSIQPKGRGFGS